MSYLLAVGEFQKVNKEVFKKSLFDFADKYDGVVFTNHNNFMDEMYENLKFPNRATAGSAGYDICIPFSFDLKPHESVIIPTGFKCKIDIGWVLKLYPRSGLGFKYNLTLLNTIGVIDSDYFGNESNDGHIMVGIKNGSDKVLHLEKGDRFCQAIFEQFGITFNDETNKSRIGGFGSTGLS